MSNDKRRRNILKGVAATAALELLPEAKAGNTGAAIPATTPRIIAEGSVPRWDGETEVLVIGLGCAGAAAAIEAARAGAHTLVLEWTSGGGGTSAMSGGNFYFGGGTPVQRANGFEDNAEEMFKYLAASTGIAPDLEKIRLYCDGSLEHFQWVSALGVPFKHSYWQHNFEPWTDDCLWYSGSEKTHPYNTLARPAPRGHKPEIEGSSTGGRLLMEKMQQALLVAGAERVMDARCVALIKSARGRVVGCAAKIAGELRHYRARRGVILTTGGFIYNPVMVARYAPQARPLPPLGCGTDDGSGIQLGQAAGGECINMNAIAYTCPVLMPLKFIKGILVNEHGQRFINEDVNHKRIGEFAVLHENSRMYLIVDNNIYDKPRFPGVRLVAAAETIEELEIELGLPQFCLQDTVETYNFHAAQGRDPLFGKQAEHLKPLDKGPYAAFDCGLAGGAPYSAFTLGGLHTRPSGEVLDMDGCPIPGLYAAGRATSCLSAQSCGTSGIQIGEGTFFGRLAGRSAAESTIT